MRLTITAARPPCGLPGPSRRRLPISLTGFAWSATWRTSDRPAGKRPTFTFRSGRRAGRSTRRSSSSTAADGPRGDKAAAAAARAGRSARRLARHGHVEAVEHPLRLIDPEERPPGRGTSPHDLQDLLRTLAPRERMGGCTSIPTTSRVIGRVRGGHLGGDGRDDRAHADGLDPPGSGSCRSSAVCGGHVRTD